MTKIYYCINEIIQDYINEGVDPKQFMYYFNENKENFKYMYNRIYKRLTLKNIQFDSEQLKEYLIDILQDNVYLINDLDHSE